MFGGRVYAWPLADLLPDWAKDCPVERSVVRENLAFLTENASLTVSLDSPKLAQGRGTSFTALRAKFDAWLAKKAQDAGAMLVTGIRVDDLWREGGRVKGVSVAPNDHVAAELVVIAEGAAPTLMRKAGLRADLEPREVSVGIKETVELPPEAIQDRFGLGEKEGAAFVYAGYASMGLRGGGFLYTNKASVSLGLVVSSEDLSRKKMEVQDLQTKFRMHPAVQRLLRGGKVVEYSAHLVPELGVGMMPPPSTGAGRSASSMSSSTRQPPRRCRSSRCFSTSCKEPDRCDGPRSRSTADARDRLHQASPAGTGAPGRSRDADAQAGRRPE